MLKRYFKSFDTEGWFLFISGCSTFILTCFLTYTLFNTGHPFLAGLITYVGTKLATRFISVAALGSIYRHKEDKNKDLYMANKERLDKRFKTLFDDDPTDSDDENKV